jgi:hypothetical protein
VYYGPTTVHPLLGLNTEHADMDGDGIEDMALTSYDANYVVAGGGASGTYDVTTAALATIAVRGELSVTIGDIADTSTADYDHDGVPDLIVGTWFSGPGVYDPVVYAFHGPISGTLGPSDAAATWVGDYVGFWLATGDCNGDKEVDVILGATRYDYVSFGPVSGTIDVTDLLLFTSPGRPGGAFGSAFAFVPDWSGDDADEVVFGGILATTDAGANAGAVYVYDSEHFY